MCQGQGWNFTTAMAVVAPHFGLDALLKIVCPSATVASVVRALPVMFLSFPPASLPAPAKSAPATER